MKCGFQTIAGFVLQISPLHAFGSPQPHVLILFTNSIFIKFNVITRQTKQKTARQQRSTVKKLHTRSKF